MHHFLARWTMLITALVVVAAPGRADEFVLKTGGRIHGTWLNPAERPVECYVIRLEQGGQLRLNAAQVAIARRQSSAEIDYEQRAPACPDTVSGHWQLAGWCGDQQLTRQRDFHLRRILALDPEHVPAWHALGYSQIGGTWATRSQRMRAQGYVPHAGKWRTVQEIELLERRQRDTAAEGEWFAKLRRWRNQLLSDDPRQAWLQVASIRDPHAVRGLTALLARESHYRLKRLYIEVLAEIDDRRALAALIAAALHDSDEEVFHACLEPIAARKSPEVVKLFANMLKDENNYRVNRAAQVLARLEDPSAMQPLINALVTTHHHVVPGSNTLTFGFERQSSVRADGVETTGMRGPRGPRVIPYQTANPAVLDALVQLSGGASFGYDQRAWGYWLTLRQQQDRHDLQARRD